MRRTWARVWAGVVGAVLCAPGVARADEVADLKARVRALERENQELRAEVRGGREAAPADPAASEHARCGQDGFRPAPDVALAAPASAVEAAAPGAPAAPASPASPFSLTTPDCDSALADQIYHFTAG